MHLLNELKVDLNVKKSDLEKVMILQKSDIFWQISVLKIDRDFNCKFYDNILN